MDKKIQNCEPNRNLLQLKIKPKLAKRNTYVKKKFRGGEEKKNSTTKTLEKRKAAMEEGGIRKRRRSRKADFRWWRAGRAVGGPMSLGYAKWPEGPLARTFTEADSRFTGCFARLQLKPRYQKACNSWLLAGYVNVEIYQSQPAYPIDSLPLFLSLFLSIDLTNRSQSVRNVGRLSVGVERVAGSVCRWRAKWRDFIGLSTVEKRPISRWQKRVLSALRFLTLCTLKRYDGVDRNGW